MKHLFIFVGQLVAIFAAQSIAPGNRLLTPKIYKELSKTSGDNFLVSPLSLQTVLALTQSGARDETGEEIRNSLNLPTTKEETDAAIQDLLPRLRSRDYVLDLANKIYVQKNYTVNEDFAKVAKDVYDAGVDNLNFEADDAAQTINQWVEQATNNKIREVITAGDLDDSTRLVLINALYFRANWTIPFHAIHTRPKDFTSKSSKLVQVETMEITDNFNYYECSKVDAKFLELALDGGNASVVFVLPNKIDGIDDLEGKIENVFTPRNFSSQLVRVDLPKFKIESTISFPAILKQLGIERIFNEQADLSGIAGQKGDLVVNSVVQKTFIDVQELGVEAAAASALDVSLFSGVLDDTQFKLFTADHPFIFYVKIDDFILFGGRVGLPQL